MLEKLPPLKAPPSEEPIEEKRLPILPFGFDAFFYKFIGPSAIESVLSAGLLSVSNYGI